MADAQQRNDVAAEKSLLARAIAHQSGTIAALQRMSFPSEMAADVLASINTIRADQMAEQNYVDSSDDGARKNAVYAMNVANRAGINAGNQIRVDLGIQPVACPYNGP
jgi:hypothetical protein